MSIIQRLARIWRLGAPEPPRPAIVYLDNRCRCEMDMGSDFWFLPTGSCLYGTCTKKGD